MSILGWLLILFAGTVITCYPFLSKQSSPLITALPAGVLVALGAQLLAQAKNIREAIEKRSQFFLESCNKAYEEAYQLLQDGNNERIKWIAAGRALVHAKELAFNVSEDMHKRVLELHKLKYRRFFHEALADKPAAFFYGATDISISTNTAAELSTKELKQSDRHVSSTVNELSDKSIRAVWEASQWPVDYRDPLAQSFSDQEIAKLSVLFPGLHEYLEHKQNWRSVAGRLVKKQSNGGQQ